MTPSTTIGSAARPIGSSISVIQASPRRPTFLSLICFSGLNCCWAKLPPLTSQLSPIDASAATRAAVTLPAAPAAAQPWELKAATAATATPRVARFVVVIGISGKQCTRFPARRAGNLGSLRWSGASPPPAISRPAAVRAEPLGAEARRHVVGDARNLAVRIGAAEGRHVRRPGLRLPLTAADDDLGDIDRGGIVDGARPVRFAAAMPGLMPDHPWQPAQAPS